RWWSGQGEKHPNRDVLVDAKWVHHQVRGAADSGFQVGLNLSGTSNTEIFTSSCGGLHSCAIKVSARISIGAVKLASELRSVLLP
ncbi:hypothetical protein ACP0BX_001483, partial [Amphidinium carterae]